MDAGQIRGLLFDFGHAWGPANPAAHRLTRDEFLALPDDDERFKLAVRSFQDFNYIALDQFSIEHNDRLAYADGEIGPATLALLGAPRCACPDYQNPHEATGSGSWPSGCLDPWPNHHAIRVAVDTRRASQPWRDKWDDIKKIIQVGYAQIGLVVLFVDKDESSEVDLYWKVLPGSVIGMAQFNNRTCRDNVFHQLDPGYTSSLQMMAGLVMHELGHNCNLQHTRGGIMNPSIIRVPNDWREDVSYRTLKRYFGGEQVPGFPPSDTPVPPGPGPDPGPTPRLVLRGETTVELNGQAIGTFIYVPKPRL